MAQLDTQNALNVACAPLVQGVGRFCTRLSSFASGFIRYRRADRRQLIAERALAEENERRRIAIGLHDDIGHDLAIAKMKLGELQNTGEQVDPRVDEVREILSRAIGKIRSLTFDLSSPALYELGLEAGLQSIGERLEAQHGVRFEFEDDNQPKPVTDAAGVILFRCVRELLFNIVKHAHARSMKVQLSRIDDHMRIVVADDGVGFTDLQSGSAGIATQTFGLCSIREQLDSIGGRMDMDAARSGGARIVMTVPVEDEA